MRTVITLENQNKREIPEKFKGNDNRFSESFVEFFIEKFTKKNDKVLDIFAGLGTTLFVAEEMGRIPYGIEFDLERVNYIKKNLANKSHIIHGDSLKLNDYNIPKCDFCLTSPPYMNHYDIENPFTNCKTESSYEQYLNDIKIIFTKVKEIMKPNSFIIVEVSNLKNNDKLTTLAWDIGIKISEVISFEGELIINWRADESSQNGTYGYGYDHSYCLVYINK